MATRTCGHCDHLKADGKGQTACFGRAPGTNPSYPVYRMDKTLGHVLVSEAVYPLVASTTPACGDFEPKFDAV